MVKTPPIRVCKDCPDRYPGCHDTCEKHKAEVEDLRKRQQYLRKYGDRYRQSGVAYEQAVAAFLYRKAKQRRK